jgi:protein-disulfide isomerase
MRRLVLFVLFLAFSSLAAQAPGVEGFAKSTVRVVAYEDLQCRDCAAYRRMLDEKLLPKYGARVAFEHRDFPLAKHAWSRRAAIAARFFQEVAPELGVAYRRQTLANLSQITPENFRQKLAAFAKLHGIDPDRAVAALNDARYAVWVEKDYQEGVARGVVHTPTVFVDGQPFVETFTFEEISQTIEKELSHP